VLKFRIGKYWYHARRKLCPHDVRSIRSLIRKRFTYPEIAERFGICRSNVQAIKVQRSWRKIA
jgi:hypothetical protein